MGPKHSLPNTHSTFPLYKCIAEGEDCIQTIESREQQEIGRAKFTALIENHLHKVEMNQRDRHTLNTVAQSRKFLKEHDDILILSADKGGKTVAMTKIDYESKMNNIVKDMCTYRRLTRDPTTCLQNKNNTFVDTLFNMNIITLTEKKKLTSKTALPPRIYGLPKIHKDGLPLRPICSSVNSPSHGLSRYIADILKNLTKNSQYNVRDAIDFKSKLNDIRIEEDEILISFDVVSLFPSIPINLALRIIESKWDEMEKYTTIPKDLFMKILTFCIKDSRYFKYQDKIYGQLKGMPMGSPASPVVSDVVMEELLHVSIQKMNRKPKILTKYVDDIFAVINKKDIDNTLQILNAYHRHIQFTKEEELDNKLPYLDSVVIRHGNNLITNWYQKSTATGRLINYYSKHPRRTIINTAKNFISRVLMISDKQFHDDNKQKIINILSMNDFPMTTIKDLINRIIHKKDKDKAESTQAKIYKPMTFIPGLSERFKHSDIYNKDKIELAFKTHNTINQLFSRTKSKVMKEDKSNIVYQIKCDGDDTDICQKVYVGTTKTKLKTRLSSHKSDHKATDKPLEQKTALAAHCTLTGHTPNFDDVNVLVEERNPFRRYTLEMLYITDVPADKRLNYKTDTDKCSQMYRHVVNKHGQHKA